ncbi:MAG TPA: aromatic ring-hydroxylating dioxygenase subunit alpha [Terriglobales bacterium]|nr:aromatic ring-hydroxylating dioxygenase subunit alpha [Terriglobales bacterium]
MFPDLLQRRQAGYGLDPTFYTSDSIFQKDIENVFLENWLFAGHANRIPNPGDYFLFEVANESFIVIRDAQMRVHALVNVCRHRGSRICIEGEGTARSLVCPYHQWVYRHDGALLNARFMPEDFDVAKNGLFRAHVEVLEDLIFISSSNHPPDFEPFRRAMEPRLRPHDLPRARIAHKQEYEIAANWKLVVENSRECYHCGVAHPQYCKAVRFAAAVGSEKAQAEASSAEAQAREEAQSLGLPVEEIPFLPDTWYHYRRFFLRPGHVTESMDGKPVAPLMGTIPNHDTGVFAIVTLPNLLLEASGDYVMTLCLTPKAPQLTSAEVTWLVRGDAQEGIDYDVGRLTKFWRLTSEQDWMLCENNQKGINSAKYIPGVYAPSETGVEHFVQWYIKQLQNK